MTVRKNRKWTDPAFYRISPGAEIGGSGGAVAFLLIGCRCLLERKKSLSDTGAGPSIVNYSANSQVSWGKGALLVGLDDVASMIIELVVAATVIERHEA